MGETAKVAVAENGEKLEPPVVARVPDHHPVFGLLEGFSTTPKAQPKLEADVAEAAAERAKLEDEAAALPDKIREAVQAADGKAAITLKKRSAELTDEIAAARIRELRLRINHAEAAREDLAQRLPSLRATLEEADTALKAAQEHRTQVSRTLQAIRSAADNQGDQARRMGRRLAEVFAEQGL
jgi:chromosome segregation ATPase